MKINKKGLVAGVLALSFCTSLGLGISLTSAETAGDIKSDTPQTSVTATADRAYYANNEDSIVAYGKDPNTSLFGIKAQLALYDSVTVRNVIDLEEMEQNEQPFIFIQPIVEDCGTAEYTKITLEIIDSYDPTNYVKVIINASPQNEDASGISYFLACASNGQKPTGFEDGHDKLHVNNEYGQWSPFSFSAKDLQYSGTGFYYEASQKKIYAQDAQGNRRRIIDFDDPMHFGTNLWNGFTTNEVYCRLSCSSYKRDKASIMITQYGNYDLTKEEITDEVAPALYINYGDYTKETVPSALRGKKYKIFDANAFDTIDGAVKTDVKVYSSYYSADDMGEVSVSSTGYFTPRKTQPHHIVYTSKDARGNQVQEIVEVDVVQSCDPVAIDFEDVSYSVVEGDAYHIPAYTISGGLGIVNLTMKATLNGKEIPIEGKAVRPYASGSLKITYSLEDYIGQKQEVVHDITVTDAVKPTFIEAPILPKYLIAKNNYTLPALNAYNYVTAEGTAIPTTVSVVEDGVEKSLNNGVYTVGDSATKAEIIYTAKIGNATNEYRVELPVRNVYNGEDLDMSKYFMPAGENGTTSASGYSVVLTATGDEEFEYLNYVTALNLTTEFSLQKDYTNLRKFHIILTDITDSERQLKFTYVFSGATMQFYLNDNEAGIVPITGNSAEDFRLYLNFNAVEKKVFYDISTKNVLPITTFMNGETFEGFAKNRAYVTYSFEDVKGTASMAIHTLNGHYFSEETRDWITPLIELTGDVGGEYTLWDEIYLPEIIANDVLSGDVNAYVTLMAPSGNYVTTLDGKVLNELRYEGENWKVVFAEYGNYILLITTQDKDGNFAQIPVAYSVIDQVKPVLTLSSEIVETAKVGDNVKVPKATATDNIDDNLTVTVYVIAPSGHVINIDDETGFTATKAGIYTVVYMVSDTEGNFDFEYHMITVTEV